MQQFYDIEKDKLSLRYISPWSLINFCLSVCLSECDSILIRHHYSDRVLASEFNQQLDCLFDRMFRRTSKKTPKFAFVALYEYFPHKEPVMRTVCPCCYDATITHPTCYVVTSRCGHLWCGLEMCRLQGSVFEPRLSSQVCICGKNCLTKGVFSF